MNKYNHCKVIVGHGGGDACRTGSSLAPWSIPPLAPSQSISIFWWESVPIFLFFFLRPGFGAMRLCNSFRISSASSDAWVGTSSQRRAPAVGWS